VTARPGQGPVPEQGGAGSSVLTMLVVCLIGGGLVVAGISTQLHRWSPPPVPPASAAQPALWESARGAAETRTPAVRHPNVTAVPMSRSAPVAVRIPAIGVRAQVISLGLDPSGGVAVPSLATPQLVSWYDGGSAPGQPGPAVLLGHVDSATVGPAVFYLLGKLRPGDMVYVTRGDHRTAVFRTSSVALYPQGDFPTKQVYGATARPTLRLVTCGGQFDPQSGHYLDRIIAFATYVGQEALPVGVSRGGGVGVPPRHR
jgi:sortase (surface protein transpeptidase)